MSKISAVSGTISCPAPRSKILLRIIWNLSPGAGCHTAAEAALASTKEDSINRSMILSIVRDRTVFLLHDGPKEEECTQHPSPGFYMYPEQSK